MNWHSPDAVKRIRVTGPPEKIRREARPAGFRCAAFEAQFAGRYGRLRFIRDRLIVDEAGPQAAVSWRCEHGLDAAIAPAIRRIL